MGYCMDQEGCDFEVLAANKPKALAAIKELATHKELMGGGSYSGGKQTDWWFSWVDMKALAAATTLEDATKAWRWECTTGCNGDVVGISFRGEKRGDERLLFEAIAPFIEEGSYIEMVGEDGFRWRWVFSGGKVKDITPTILWGEVQ